MGSIIHLRQKFDFSNKLILFLIFLLPFIVFFISKSILLQSDYVDPFYYTGYIHNYSDLLERYGRTYYSARISFIYPQRFLAYLLGDKLGYTIFRYLLLTGLLLSIWKITKTYFNSIMGLLAVIIVAFNPWILRSLFYDYCDGTAIVYLMVALHFLISEYKHQKIAQVCAGFFYALCINCNLFLITTIGLFFLPWLILNQSTPIRKALNKILYIGVGFLGCYFFLCVISYLEFPNHNPFIEIAAFEMSKYRLAGNGIEYWHPLNTLLNNISYCVALICPVIIFTVSHCMFSLTNKSNNKLSHNNDKSTDVFGSAMMLYLGLTLSLYIVLHIFKLDRITWFYYFSYTFPATILTLIWLLGNSFRSFSDKLKPILFFLILFIYGLSLWATQSGFLQTINNNTLIYIYLVAIFFLITSLWMFRKQNVKNYIVLLIISLFPFFFINPLYDIFSKPTLHNQTSSREWDVYEGATQLQKWLSFIPTNEAIVFWYNSEYKKFEAIQAVLLWGHNSLAEMLPKAHNAKYPMNMPNLDNVSINKLDGLNYLAILGASHDEVITGKKNIEQFIKMKNLNFKMTFVMEQKYLSDNFNYYLLILKKESKS